MSILTDSDNALLTTALACINAGISIIPIDHATKRPAVDLLPKNEDGRPTWKPYQSAIVDEGTVRSWFEAGNQAIAVVGGRVSGGLLVLDFDAPGFIDRWAEAVGELAKGLPVQQTGGGGHQVLLRCPSPGGNDKLAWAADDAEPTGRTIAIETRGEGGYAVIAPSLHPSGDHYKWLGALTAADVPIVTHEHAARLLAAARGLDEAPLTRQERERQEQQADDAYRQRRLHGAGQGSVIDAFNTAHPVESLLERYGYAKGSRGRYIRPGGRSESVSVREGRTCHWSSNDPLNDGRGRGGCGCHDAFDLFAHFQHGGDVSRAVRAAAELLGMSTIGRVNVHETRPLRDEAAGCVVAGSHRTGYGATATQAVQLYRPFPLEVFPKAVARFIQEGAAAMSADPAFFALPILSAAGACIGNSRRVLVKSSWSEPAVIWTGLVVPSGGGKSPAFRAAMAPIYKRQAELSSAARDMDEDRDPWDGRSGAQPSAGGEHLVVADATTEGLAVRLDCSPRGLLLAVDELAGWFQSFNQYKQKGGDKQAYLSMYDAATLKIDRKNATPPTIFIPRAFVAVCGGIQPGILRRVCSAEDFESGLLARFLFAMPPVRPAQWTDAVISKEAEAELEAIFNRLLAMPMKDDGDGFAPVDVPLSLGARAAFIDFFNDSQRRQADEDDDRMAATWSKLRGAAARLALVIHQLSVAAGEPAATPEMIDEASMRAGIRLAYWFADEARRVFRWGEQPAPQRQIVEVAELVQSMGGRVTPRDLRHKRRKYRDNPELAEADLQRLVDAGAGAWEYPAPDVQGGRPRKVFVLAVNETPDGGDGSGGSVDVDGVEEERRKCA